MKHKYPCFVILILLLCFSLTGCSLPPDTENTPHTLEITGLPAPKSGEDPYRKLDSADRAEAFLKNADALDPEMSPFLLYGHYVVPTVKYIPGPELMPERPGFDRTEQILDFLHKQDVSSLTRIDVPEDTSAYVTQSGVIRVGEASCRAALWIDTTSSDLAQRNSLLVFTFSDGTMCAFDGGDNGNQVSDFANAYNLASSNQPYILFGTGGDMTVTQLSFGESKIPSPYSAGLARSILDATFTYSTPVASTTADFGYRIEFEDGSTYLFDWETFLVQTADGKIYSVDGFGEEDSATGLLGLAFVLDFEEFSLY